MALLAAVFKRSIPEAQTANPRLLKEPLEEKSRLNFLERLKERTLLILASGCLTRIALKVAEHNGNGLILELTIAHRAGPGPGFTAEYSFKDSLTKQNLHCDSVKLEFVEGRDRWFATTRLKVPEHLLNCMDIDFSVAVKPG